MNSVILTEAHLCDQVPAYRICTVERGENSGEETAEKRLVCAGYERPGVCPERADARGASTAPGSVCFQLPGKTLCGHQQICSVCPLCAWHRVTDALWTEPANPPVFRVFIVQVGGQMCRRKTSASCGETNEGLEREEEALEWLVKNSSG